MVLLARSHLFGPDHIETICAMENLSLTLELMGDQTAATELLKNIIEAKKRTLGSEHPDTLESIQTLANLQAQQMTI